MPSALYRSLCAACCALALACAAMLLAAPAHAAPNCDRVVSPSGSDSNDGTAASPFRSLRRLAHSLSPGQTGCLRAGDYGDDLYTTTPRVTFTSYPGERATVSGLTVMSGDGDVVSGLNLHGPRGQVSPGIYGDGVQLIGNDISNFHHGRSCILVGDHANQPVRGVVIRANVIHDCGRLPSTNLDHGIYVLSATGTDVSYNTFYGNADWGIQLYPGAERSDVHNNIVDDNGKGIILGGADGLVSKGNDVHNNIFSSPNLRDNVMSWWPTSDGRWRGGDPGNVVENNCLSGGKHADNGGIDNSQGGFATRDNTVAEPQFVNRSAHDYHLKPTSPCLPVTGDIAAQQDAGGAAPAPRAALGRRAVTSHLKGIRVRRTKHGLRIVGRFVGSHRRVRHVVLQVREGHHWRRVKRAAIRKNGSFEVRGKRLPAGPLRLAVPALGAAKPLSAAMLRRT